MVGPDDRMKVHDVLIRQVNALPRRRKTALVTEWQLSRPRGAAITRTKSLDEALEMAETLLAGGPGCVWVQKKDEKPERYQGHATSLK